MSSNDRQMTAIERARIAYELMMRRQRERARQRRSRERSRAVNVIVACVGVVALLIGIAIYNSWLPLSLRTAATLSPGTEAGRFGETRTGQVRSFVKGNTCQELQFSNDRGVYVGGNLVPCQVEVRREVQQPTA